MAYWPWWVGALALATVTLSYWFSVGRPLGVSASWARLFGPNTDREDDAFNRAAEEQPDALAAALAAATLAQFPELAAAEAQPSTADAAQIAPLRLLPRANHVVFLISLGLGGTLAALVSPQGFSLKTTLGPSFERLFHQGWSGALGLVVGGVLVGFGTRMAGGCTSGHGLSGVSRFQMGSLVATAVFFGTSIVTALLLHGVMS